MAKFAVGDKVQVISDGFYGNVTGTVEGLTEGGAMTEGLDQTSYSVDMDVGGIAILKEAELAQPGEVRGGTYSYRYDFPSA